MELFVAAGYTSLDDMEENVFYKPKKKLEIASIDPKLKEKVFKKVNAIIFKGYSKGYEVELEDKTFFCTEDHGFYDSESSSFVEAKKLYPEFIGINSSGDNVVVNLKKTAKEFPVLDLEVDGLNSYLSGGILSHNSFGGTAKVFAEGLKFLNPLLSRHGTSLILINQERANMGMFGADFQTTGGWAIKYYSSWRARITKVAFIKEKGITVGIEMKVRNTKSKIGIPFREAELHLNFDEGFNSNFEYMTFLVDLGIVEKRGGWYYQEEWGFKGQGKDKVSEFLNENPEIFAQVKNTVNALLAEETVLDADNIAPDEESDEEIPEE